MNITPDELDICDVFHDECKEDGFWHCFLFIPRKSESVLFNLLQEPRKNLNYWDTIHFSNINKKCKSSNSRIRLIKSWCTILLYSLQSQKIDAQLYLGNRNNTPIYKLVKENDNIIGCKLVIFREKEGLKDMYKCMTTNRKIETTFRMGLKGGAHFLFHDEEVIIDNIYIDFPKEVYENKFDSENMLDRFKNESKENIFFTEDSTIMPIGKKNYKIKEPISEFMQLADIAVGGIRCQKLQIKDFKARFDATYPLKELLEKETENSIRMGNSKYYKGFALSEAWIENGEWKFKAMHIDAECENLFRTLF